MPKPDDELLSPTDLHRKVPKFGLEFQRAHREAGDFIPHIRLGSRIFYRLSSVTKFLEDQESKDGRASRCAPAPGPRLVQRAAVGDGGGGNA
jgi:hypothetical protein